MKRPVPPPPPTRFADPRAAQAKGAAGSPVVPASRHAPPPILAPRGAGLPVVQPRPVTAAIRPPPVPAPRGAGLSPQPVLQAKRAGAAITPPPVVRPAGAGQPAPVLQAKPAQGAAAPPPFARPTGAGQPPPAISGSSTAQMMKRKQSQTGLPDPKKRKKAPKQNESEDEADDVVPIRRSTRNKGPTINYEESSEEEVVKIKKVAEPLETKEITRGKESIGKNRVSAHKRGTGNKEPFTLRSDLYQLYENPKKNKRRLSQKGREWYNNLALTNTELKNNTNIETERESVTQIVPVMFQQISMTRGSFKDDLGPKINSNRESYIADKKKGDKLFKGIDWTKYSTLCEILDSNENIRELAGEILDFLDSIGKFKTSTEYDVKTQRAIDVFIAVTHIAEEARTVGAGKHVRSLLQAVKRGKGTFTSLFVDSDKRYFSAVFEANQFRQESFQKLSAKTTYDKYYSDDSGDEYSEKEEEKKKKKEIKKRPVRKNVTNKEEKKKK